MSSWTHLYIGDSEFSWRSFVPEFVTLLFTSDEYIAETAVDDDGDELEYYWHRFASNVGKVKARLEEIGISLQLLRDLHHAYFRFDPDEYRESLEFHIFSYLQEKYGRDKADRWVPKFTQRLMRRIPQLSVDDEFLHALAASTRRGSRQSKIDLMRRFVEEIHAGRVKPPGMPSDPVEIRRLGLREFLSKDPFVTAPNDLDDSESSEIFMVYPVSISIFASESHIPIELDISEMIESEKALTRHEVDEFLDGNRAALKLRVDFTKTAFAGLTRRNVGQFLATGAALKGRNSKETGDVLEDFVAQLFQEDPSFTIRRQIKTGDEEIDLVILNRQIDPFWQALNSPLLFVECRNRKRKVRALDVRDFEVKLQNAGSLCRLGVMVSRSGFSKECVHAVQRASREGYRIILADRAAIRVKLEQRLNIKEWIENLLLDQL
jgi:hypothetical protein